MPPKQPAPPRVKISVTVEHPNGQRFTYEGALDPEAVDFEARFPKERFGFITGNAPRGVDLRRTFSLAWSDDGEGAMTLTAGETP